MQEGFIEKLDIDYVTYDDLMKLAKDVPVGSYPSYHLSSSFTDTDERHVGLNVSGVHLTPPAAQSAVV